MHHAFRADVCLALQTSTIPYHRIVSRFGVTPLVSSLRECCDSFLQIFNFFGKAPSGVGEEDDKLPVLSSSPLSLCSNCFANPHRHFPSPFPRLLRGFWCGLEALITGFPPLK